MVDLPLNIGGMHLGEVEPFRYLGSTITATNISVDVLHRLQQVHKCFHSTKQVMSVRNISKGAKIKIYKSAQNRAHCYIWKWNLGVYKGFRK